ncbi:MAG: GtrA family protein [Cyanobacteriota bacterium]|jgi:putative flippase GtrA
MSRTLSERQKFGRFLLTGGSSAIVNIISRGILSSFVNFSTSVILSYVIGMVLAYTLARRYVFVSSKASRARSISGFIVVNIFGALLTLFFSVQLRALLGHLFGLNTFVEYLAHFLALSVSSVTSFVGHKFISFRDTPSPRLR